MSQEKRTRAEAARRNGAKSKGPTTPEGLRQSSQNARKHGCLSRAVVLEDEDPTLFDELQEAYFETYKPQNRVELDLVNEMVMAQWRCQRIHAFETSLLTIESLRNTETVDREFSQIHAPARQALAFKNLADSSNTLEMMSRYESRYRRLYDRALHALLAIRSNPLATQPSAAAPPVQPTPNPPNEPKPRPIPFIRKAAAVVAFASLLCGSEPAPLISLPSRDRKGAVVESTKRLANTPPPRARFTQY